MKNKYNREIFLKSKVEINKFNISISTDQIKKKLGKKVSTITNISLGCFLTLTNSLILCRYQLTVQNFNSDTDYAKLVSDPTGLRAQSQKTALNSDDSCKYQITHTSDWPVINLGISTTLSSVLIIC